MKSLEISTKQKIFLWVSVTLLIIIGVLIFNIVPRVQTMFELSNRFTAREAEIMSLVAKKSTSDFLQKDLLLYEDALADLNTTLLKPGNEINFLQLLEDVSAQFNVTQTIQLTEQSEDKKSFFPHSFLTLNISGRFYDVLLYVNALERGPYYILIDSLSLEKSSASVQTVATGAYSLPIVTSPMFESTENVPDLSNASQSTLTGIIQARVFWYNQNEADE